MYLRELRLTFFMLLGVIMLGAFTLATGDDHPFKAPFQPEARFHGYACFDGCEEHRSGFRWAQQSGVADVAHCRHINRAFSEGCSAWVRDGAAADGRAP